MRKITEYPLNGKLKEKELRRMPRAHLIMLLATISTTSKKIAGKIDDAYDKKRLFNKTINPKWLARVTASKESKKSHREIIEKELGIRKTKRAKKNRRLHSAA